MINHLSSESTPDIVPIEAQYPTFPGANIGSIGLRHTVQAPSGYHYTDTLGGEDAVRLLHDHYPLPDQTLEDWQYHTADFMRSGGTLIYVGIAEDETDKLVGMGALSRLWNQGVLSNFVVDAEHRGKGIGKAIVDERLEIADRIGVTLLQIPRLEDTNTLRGYYAGRGFLQSASGQFIRLRYGLAGEVIEG